MQSRTQQAEIQRISTALALAEKSQNSDTQLKLYQELARLVPGTALIHAQIAHLLFERQQEQQAADHVETALALPHDIKVDRLIFQHMCKLTRYTTKPAQAREWFNAQPNLWRFKLLHEALNRIEAREELERVIHDMLELPLLPAEQSQILTLLAQQYFGQARYHDAIGCYQLGLELDPGNQTQLFNLAGSLEHVGRYEEAFKYYKQVLSNNPEHAGTHNNIALIMLRLGEFQQGWQHNEWRWKASQPEHAQHFSIPRWNGESLEGKVLLVWAEQGIGDHIMFASMLNELREFGGTLHYEIYARLDDLFTRSFDGVNFLRRETMGEEQIEGKRMFKQSWPRADFQIPIGSLGGILRNDLASFGSGKSFLTADPQASQDYKDKYARLFPGKRLIGLSWRGGKTMQTERQSRRAQIQDLLPLSELSNVQFIDLQYDSTAEEIAEMQAAGLSVYHDDTVDARIAMDPQASQISALDAVISVDNTTVHLAGALGVPTYVLVQLNPNWRWGLKEGRSYWYNSVQLFRNPALIGWNNPLERIITALQTDGII
ncbi:tetratricopeptide repeat protein [Pseudomonas bohemica]|uniref:tetratricopeptide repeat protein n=1 Tax=Pseudomonas bohemica TaxID=2044872 RepID=UPI000DA6267C|nr:tetratricopeptide repeat protein [Pseudomonas bohemica]